MQLQLSKYSDKLIADRSALPEFIGFAVQDDQPVSSGDDYLSSLAIEILSSLNSTALLVARPPLPWSDFLIRRTAPDETVIVPRDSETRTFLHDIPFLRQKEISKNKWANILELLSKRKGIIVEGMGIVASGAITVEQAYINYSSVFHAVFVKYLQDILKEGFRLQGEESAFMEFRKCWLRPLDTGGLFFREGPLDSTVVILDEIEKVGRYTVEKGLVDSFFGNISAFDGKNIYISQTGASLDELAGCIDPVAMDDSSTAGLTASSELPAHRRIYEKGEAMVILHGHPKFSVVMSMVCEIGDCPVTDCWKECPHVRFLAGIPVVAGETGAGGLAGRMPELISEHGKALVYGHGLFATGRHNFAEAFRSMVDVENWCRNEYFRRIG